MTYSSGIDQALSEMKAGFFSPQALEGLSGLTPEDRTVPLEAQLLEVLSTTGDARIRNAAALALSDLHSDIAALVIQGLCFSKRTDGSRATLLYALKRMHSKLSVLQIFYLLATDVQEVQEECIAFLEEDLTEETVLEPQMLDFILRLTSVSDTDRTEDERDLFDEAVVILEAKYSRGARG